MTHAWDLGSGADLAGLLTVLVAAAVTVAVLVAGTAVWARAAGKVSVVDVMWGLLFVGIAWASCLVGPGDLARRMLLAVMTTVWGVRLARHVYVRSRGKGEDPRYVEMLERRGATTAEQRQRAAVTRVYAVQGSAALFVGLPLVVGAVPGVAPGWLAYVGVAVWAVGLTFEAVGDSQLRRFKADPAHRGVVMDRGLWSWTRHPNYFGDALVWWGVWLVAADAWPGVLTVLSPALMTYFLVAVTGARLLEETMSQRPGWADYAARTSFFWPRPPRRS